MSTSNVIITDNESIFIKTDDTVKVVTRQYGVIKDQNVLVLPIISVSQPSDPYEGLQWFQPVTHVLSVYHSGAWEAVEGVPQGGTSGQVLAKASSADFDTHWIDQTGGGGSGSVSSVSVTTANGVSGTVANPTTSPAISLVLGNITPTSVAATGSVTGSNLSGSSHGTNTGDQDLSGYALTSSLAPVATSGVYSDLIGKPSLATVATTGAYSDLSGKPTLSTVATTGAYSDLTGKPTIPTAVSQLTNDSGFITGNQSITVNGDITGSGTTSIATTLATVNSNVGTFGSTTQIPVIVVNAKGLVTGVTLATIAAGGVTSFNTRNGAITLTSLDVTNALTYTPYNSTNPSGYTSNTGTVTSVAATGTQGISISGSPITSSGTLTVGLGAITPISVAASGTLSGSNFSGSSSGTNTGDQTSVTGNAGTATKLATARNITASGDAAWTVSFDGSADVTAGLTLATVNSSPQTNTFTKTTINGKGLTTATTAVGSSDITGALGYTPYNSTNPAGYTTNLGTVTSVTATSPVASTGGTTPVISMPAATTTVDGYLTHTDWNTFNSKGSGNGTVTSVAATGSQGVSISGSPITGSGTIAIGLGAITPTSVAASGTVTGSNLSGSSSGANTGDQTITLTGDATGSGTGSFAVNVGKINGTSLGGLATGILKNTTTTGIPSIAVAADFPTLNQNTTGNAATVTTNANLTGAVTSVGNATTYAGTLGTTLGGTNVTSYTTGDILYASASNVLSKLAIGSTGNVLTIASGIPSWAAPSGGGTSYTLQPVLVATTANGTISTAYANGQVIDGVTLATGNRILIKDQTTKTDNGIYTVNASGSPTRVTEFTTGAATLSGGVFVYCLTGTRNQGGNFVCTNTTAITIGTTNITFNYASPVTQFGYAAVAGPVASVAGATAVGASTASGTSAVAIGTATASANNTVAIGATAAASVAGGIAIGQNATAAGGIVIGSATSGSTSAIVLSTGNSGTGFGNIIIGQGSPSFATNNNAYLTYIGGANTTVAVASGVNNATSFGVGPSIDYCGTFNLAYGGFGAVNGSAQTTIAIGRTQTTSTAAVEVGFSNDATNTNLRAVAPTAFIILPNTSSHYFDCDIVAQVAAGSSDSASWNVRFLVQRGANAAATAIVGSSGTSAPLFATTGATTGAWAVTVTADTTNGRPAIKFSGAASTTINWVMTARVTKVSVV